MIKKNFELTYLKKAALSLKTALDAHQQDSKNEFIRDACIQRFEFCYDLSSKTLKHYLELTEANPEAIDQMSFADLIRTASERGLLLNGWDAWRNYRHARNTTSHTYDEKKAREVLSIIPDFFQEIKALLQNLETRISL